MAHTLCARCCQKELEETLIISSTVENAVDEDCLAFDGVEDKVVVYDEVTVVQASEFLLFGNSSQARVLS